MKAFSLPFALSVFGLQAVWLGPLPSQDAYALFVKDLSTALKFDNKSGIDKAVRTRPNEAIKYFEDLMRTWIGKREQDGTRQTLDILRQSFKRQFEVDTLEKLESYYDYMTNDRISILHKAQTARVQLYNAWVKAKKNEDRAGVEDAVSTTMELARRFEELGHAFKAADCWSLVASMLSNIPDKTVADKRDAFNAVAQFLRQRENWNWTKDSYYMQWSVWLKAKKAELAESEKEEKKRADAGFETDVVGLKKYVDPKAPVEVAALKFKLLKKVPKDMTFRGGLIPALWLSTAVTDKPAKLDWFFLSDIYLVREGMTRFGIKTNAGGRDLKTVPLQKIQAGSKLKPSLYYLGDKKQNPYAMYFFTGGDQEPYAGCTSNLAPTRERAILYYRSASSWEAKIAGVKVTFFDDNCNGKLFQPDPLKRAPADRCMGFGAENEVKVVAYDSMQIGKGPLMPYSACAKIGGKWLRLKAVENEERKVSVQAMHMDFFKLGTVQMKWSGSRASKPQFLIIRGKAALAPAAFDIASGKPIEVPVGEYEIVHGRISMGKGAQTMMTNIVGGDSEVIEVKEGENTLVKLGQPFKMDFQKKEEDGEVILDSLYFQIKGQGGLIYAKVQGPTPAPEVLACKAAHGKGAKVVGNYVGISSAEALNSAVATLDERLNKDGVRTMGINVGFFPVVKGDRDASTVLRFKPPYEGALIGLRVKKHKLFGKVLPIFK